MLSTRKEQRFVLVDPKPAKKPLKVPSIPVFIKTDSSKPAYWYQQSNLLGLFAVALIGTAAALWLLNPASAILTFAGLSLAKVVAGVLGFSSIASLVGSIVARVKGRRLSTQEANQEKAASKLEASESARAEHREAARNTHLEVLKAEKTAAEAKAAASLAEAKNLDKSKEISSGDSPKNGDPEASAIIPLNQAAVVSYTAQQLRNNTMYGVPSARQQLVDGRHASEAAQAAYDSRFGLVVKS